MAKKTVEEMSISEAVDNLTKIAEMEDIKSEDVSVDDIQKKFKKVKWVDSKKKEKTLSTVKDTFKTVHNYLKHVYSKEKKHLNDIEMQKGVQAIMMLADEAAEKMDSYSPIFKKILGGESVKELKEYQDLQEFYLSKLLKRFQEALDVEQAWQEEWGSGEENLLDIQRRGLKDLETVKRDKEYELFYIRKEDGTPFFNKNLVRHIKLVTDFDELISDVEGDDPLLRIQIIQDKNANFRAEEIKQFILSYTDLFFQQWLKRKHELITVLVSKTLMALFLASNQQNLVQYTSGKNCLKYFHDFISYLRQTLSSEEYAIMIQQPPSDEYARNVIKLIHALCFSLYSHRESKIDAIAYIDNLIEKGKGKKWSLKKGLPLAFWDQVLDAQEMIQKALKKYPNGPLLKTIDTLYEKSAGFDPLKENNFSYRLFEINFADHGVLGLKVPSPTGQDLIHQASILKEYYGFLRYVDKMGKSPKCLFVNLQDRTSWKEHARCQALENLQKIAEYHHQFFIVTLAKDTDFYHQSESYEDQDDAKFFMNALFGQIKSPEETGFYFPKPYRGKQIEDFSQQAISCIHEIFFKSKKNLIRKHRLDFIEIFYFFLVLKLIEWIKPRIFNFSCKDAIDTSATSSALLYAGIKLLEDPKKMDDEEREFLLYLLFTPALLVRERPVDDQRLHRMISAISSINAVLDQNRASILESFGSLFEEDFFTSLRADIR